MQVHISLHATAFLTREQLSMQESSQKYSLEVFYYLKSFVSNFIEIKSFVADIYLQNYTAVYLNLNIQYNLHIFAD